MKNQFKIRFATIFDIDDIININLKCLPENYPRDIWLTILQDNCTLVATYKKNIVGYCAVSEYFSNPGFISICSIAVLPEYRNKGIGKHLVMNAINSYKIYWTIPLILHVRKSNLHAINLYTKLGFRLVKKIEKYYTDEDGYEMMLKD